MSDRFSALRDRALRDVEQGIVPSAQIAVAQHGEIVLHEQFGDGTTESRYVVFSCTKAITAAVMWQLLGEGQLKLDTRAAEIVDGFGDNGKDAITVRHLLTHTGGFPRAPLGPPTWASRSERIATMSRWRLNWEPDTRFEYHPTSAHWVLGEIVHSLTGNDIVANVSSRVLDPLGLRRLTLGVPADAQHDILDLVPSGSDPSPGRLAALFGIDDITLIRGEVTPDALVWFNLPEVREIGIPGAGAVSNAADLALLYQAFLQNPEGMWAPEWLQAGTADVLVTLPDPMLGHPANRTLGLIQAGDDGKSHLRGMGHAVSPRAFGHNGAAGQIAFADPDHGLSFVYLTNGIDRDFLREAGRTASLATKAVHAIAPV